MNFSSLEQRMAHSYIDTFPQFVADTSGEMTVADQAQFYALIKRLYQLAFDEPTLFVAELHEDDAHLNPFNKSSYGKPELKKNMRKFLSEMEKLTQIMFEMGSSSPVKLSQRQKNILARIGINESDALLPAWVWMSTRAGANVISFSRCFFDKSYPYLSDVYARLLGDEMAYRKLENWMLEHGYVYYQGLDAPTISDKLSLTYINPAWSKEPPRGGFEYKIRHTGVSAHYDVLVRYPPIIGLCIPNGMRNYLSAFDRMDDGVKTFVVGRTKKCDGCGYCTQTDKSGKRPKAYITVKYQDTKFDLCTYFPGYYYCWTKLDDELVDNMIAMLDFMDSMRA